MATVSPLSAKENELTAAEAKAHYTFEIAKQIIWPNDAAIDQFVVGIVGSDPELEKAFAKRKLTTVRGKSFTFETLPNTTLNSDVYSIIFITEKSRSLNNVIFSNIENTLIITDGKVDKDKQMISLISSFRKIEIKLNRDNLRRHQFEVSINLLGLAGTKEDLTEQLRDGELSLKRLLKEKQQEEENLIKLNQLMTKKNDTLLTARTELDNNRRTLKENNQRLESLSKKIEISTAEVNKNRKDITHQKKLLKEDQVNAAVREKEIDKLEASIEKNLSILDNQVNRIKQQDDIIDSRNQTIGAQRGWLTVTLVVITMFLVMTYFLVKINILRNRANKELESLNSQLYELATTDGMTKLFNRRHFMETSQNEMLRQQRKKTVSVILMIDIDNFKKVNDTYGHAAGDEVIKAVAKVLRDCSRTYDIAGRLGGEEYAMMLVDCDMTAAYEIAERLCKQIESMEIMLDGLKIKITISIGLSMVETDDKTIEQVILRADRALYEAKENGRNRAVVFID